jgi:hypothetical protein
MLKRRYASPNSLFTNVKKITTKTSTVKTKYEMLSNTVKFLRVFPRIMVAQLYRKKQYKTIQNRRKKHQSRQIMRNTFTVDSTRVGHFIKGLYPRSTSLVFGFWFFCCIYSYLQLKKKNVFLISRNNM